MIRLLQIGGSIATLVLALYLLRWDRLMTELSRINPASFLLALGLATASIATTGLRWIYIVRRLAPAPVVEHWRIYCLGTFFNSFTPANIGGDVYRVVVLRPRATGHAISNLLAAVTVERVLGLWSFLSGYLISVATLAVTDPYGLAKLPSLLLYPAAPIALVVAVMTLLPWLHHLRVRLPMKLDYAGLARHARNFQHGIRLVITRNLGVLGILSVLAWVLWVATVAVVAWPLNIGLPLALLAMIVSFTEIIRLVPISFQGIGVREGVFSALAGLAGSSPASGFVVAAAAYAALSLALAISGVIGGLLSLALPRHVPRGASE